MRVDCFTCAYSDLLQLGEAIFVDDEGLFKQAERSFKFADYEQPLTGKDLILGSDTNGETKGATSKLATIMALGGGLAVSRRHESGRHDPGRLHCHQARATRIHGLGRPLLVSSDVLAEVAT
jgi:hypothetical protein